MMAPPRCLRPGIPTSYQLGIGSPRRHSALQALVTTIAIRSQPSHGSAPPLVSMLVKAAMVIAGGAVLIVGVAPQAHADDDDTAYLSALHTVGVPPANSPITAPAYGRGLCDRLSQMGFDPLVTMVQHDMATGGATKHQSAMVIAAGITSYCLPEVDLLPKTLTY